MTQALDLGPRLGKGDRGPLRHVLELHPHGVAVEFGVATGHTLALIAQYMPVTGFDSFQGLPDDWRPGYPQGAFACRIPDIDNADIVVGLFEDTLPGWTPPGPLGLIHVDCDLYSSAATVLDCLEPHIGSGCYLVFDEFFGYPGWENHEYRAWSEFVARTGIRYDVLGHGREQWAVRIR